jgi:UPF0042 nucleotide-binding protein
VAFSITILTGQSGSGKSTAINALEDQGYFCVDNMPARLVENLCELVAHEELTERLALIIDVRERAFVEEVPDLISNLRDTYENFRVIYFESKEDILLRRYSETRRVHPLDDGCGLRSAIAKERDLLVPLRELADETVDTSSFTPHEFRAQVLERLADVNPADQLKIAFLSFGYKYGLPLEADIVLDVRFLPNPYFSETLRDYTGLDQNVYEYVLGQNEAIEFMDEMVTFLQKMIPRYQKEGKRYLTVAIGCTGGCHRSVSIARALNTEMNQVSISAEVKHRDVGRAKS